MTSLLVQMELDAAKRLREEVAELKVENERLAAHNAMLAEAINEVERARKYANMYCHLPDAQDSIAEAGENAFILQEAALSATATSIQQWLDKHDAESSMQASADALEQLLDKFAFFKSEDGLWLADAIAAMAEEMRKK